MSNNGVVIDITARDANVSATLQGVKDSLSQAAGEIGTSFQGVAGEIGEATRASGDFAEAAGGAGTAATGLGSSLMASAGPLVAFGLMYAAIRKVTEALQEGAKAQKEMAKEGEHHSKVMRDLAFDTEQYIARVQGATSSDLWRRAQLKKINDEEYKEKAKLRDLEDQMDNAERLGATGRIPDLTKERNKELDRLMGYELNWIRERARVEVDAFERGEAEKAKEGQKEAEKREQEQDREDAAAERKLQARLDREARARGQALIEQYKESQKFETDLEKASEHDAQIAQKNYSKQQEALDKFHVWALKQDELLAKKREHLTEQYVNHMVSGFTSGFAKVMRGQQTFGQFMTSMFERVQDVALGVLDKWIAAQIMAAITGKAIEKAKAVSEITSEAGVAGAGATANAAPFLGPAAVGVGESVAAATLGAFLPMASAAGGFYSIPFDQPVFTHRDEQILPAEYAKGLRSLISGGGSGANFTIIATDSKDVERQLRDQGSALNRERRRWERRGRVSR